MNLPRRPTQINWTGPNLDREAEKRAAHDLLDILQTVDNVYAQTLHAHAPFEWIFDLGKLHPDSIAFVLHTLGTGEVKIDLHHGQATITETSIPGLWTLKLANQVSLVAALLPRSVEAALNQGLDNIPEDKEQPDGLFAAQTILAELRQLIDKADLSRIPEGLIDQIDLVHQPLTPTDKSYILASVDRGPITIELIGFADSRIYSTKVRGLWRTVIQNSQGKHMLDSFVVAKIPPEVPTAREDLPLGREKLHEMQRWIQNDLARGALG